MNAGDLQFAVQAMRYLGVGAVDVRRNPRVKDINVQLSRTPVIQLGRGFMASNPRRRRQKIVHELLHCRGLMHDTPARRRGYYSNPVRDAFSRRVQDDIERGSPRFNPGRFGL